MTGTQPKRPENRPAATIGIAGFAVAVAMVMVLAPAVAGPVALATKFLTAPYKGTSWGSYTNIYYTSCSTATSGAAKWAPSAGIVLTSADATAKSCASQGGGGYSQLSDQITIVVPFRVGYNGTHLIRSNWTVTLASSETYTQGGCPAKNVNYHPPSYSSSYGECSSGASYSINIDTRVMDLSQSQAFYSNSSSVGATNQSYWTNYTSCYTYYSSPYCYNSTYGNTYAYSNGYNAPGFSAFNWNGANSFLMWTNASYMVKTDKFALVMTLYISAGANAAGVNLAKFWPASAAASIDLASHGLGAKLDSLTIT